MVLVLRLTVLTCSLLTFSGPVVTALVLCSWLWIISLTGIRFTLSGVPKDRPLNTRQVLLRRPRSHFPKSAPFHAQLRCTVTVSMITMIFGSAAVIQGAILMSGANVFIPADPNTNTEYRHLYHDKAAYFRGLATLIFAATVVGITVLQDLVLVYVMKINGNRSQFRSIPNQFMVVDKSQTIRWWNFVKFDPNNLHTGWSLMDLEASVPPNITPAERNGTTLAAISLPNETLRPGSSATERESRETRSAVRFPLNKPFSDSPPSYEEIILQNALPKT